MGKLQVVSSLEDETDQPPGTFKLIRGEAPSLSWVGVFIDSRPVLDDEADEHGQHSVVRDPILSSEPNEPLNWSTMRKSVNFTIVLAMTIVIFTAISVQAIFWQQMTIDLEVTYTQLNKAMSVNFVGLTTGCILFIPFAKKYGRRPVYIVSTALMLTTSFWTSRINSLTELYVTNLLQGLAGATNESIAEITSFLTPMAAGAQATQHSWRSCYQTMGIFNGILFVIFLFIYEETKYVPVLTGQARATVEEDEPPILIKEDGPDKLDSGSSTNCSLYVIERARSHHVLDLTIPQNPWRKRLALATPTPEPIWPHFYRPFCVLIFPAVSFAAFQYAAGLAWLTVTSNVLSLTLPEPPYLFSPAQVGYTSAGPLIGNIVGTLYGGFLSDLSILYYAKRNRGYYDPEMRLYILHLPAIFMAGGLIMFGTTISRVRQQHSRPKFAFGLGITGDAFTAVAFMRNAVGIAVPFVISPWIQCSGIQNMFIACGMLSLAITGTIIPMVLWGKSARRALAGRYRDIMEHGHAM
ncbi:unnamed protein product [Penicillium nalgiovense]|nr:unnamed protein product [Penicillium nalgiovense]